MSEKSKQRKWVREEIVVLVADYFRTKDLSSEEIKVSHEEVSKLLRRREENLTGKEISPVFRDYSGIRMQSWRIRCLDLDTEYTGMKGTRLQKEIVNEFIIKPDKIYHEADMVIAKYKQS